MALGLVGLVVEAEMNGFSVSVVADLCEALADLVEQAPGVAVKTARKLGATLHGRVAQADAAGGRELAIREQRAAKGQPDF